MIRNVVHFMAVFSAGIITGGQYVVSFDYLSTGMGASFYTEKMQYAIHHIGTPLFGMLITTTFLNLAAGFLYRKDRRTCYILIVAGALFLIGGLITRFGNIPLLDAIDTWRVSSPPANWSDVAQNWYFYHSVRLGIDVIGFFLVILSVFARRNESA